MDLLAKEMQRKKEALARAKQEAGGGEGNKRKYLKVSELRRIEEEEEERQEREKRRKHSVKQKEKDEKSTKDKETLQDRKKRNRNEKKGSIPEPSSSDKVASSPSNEKVDHHSPEQLTTQLRSFGLPVLYYGETHAQRKLRLQQALEDQTNKLQGLSEKEEFRLGQGHGIRNPFLERQEKEQGDVLEEEEEDDAKKEEQGTKDEEGVTDASDPPKYIYKFLKGLLKEWEHDLSLRPESVAKTVAGRNESKTLKQCKDYIRPLFKLCKNRRLEANLEAHLLKIVQCSQEGEFVKAHDAYIDVAIGRAAWPIGVTMVGIHARSGRAKIESSNVAHVMNSELQRKYLTSVKRLLSYAQKKRPDVDPSKKVF